MLELPSSTLPVPDAGDGGNCWEELFAEEPADWWAWFVASVNPSCWANSAWSAVWT